MRECPQCLSSLTFPVSTGTVLRESHHGGFATRKLMEIATPRFVAGLTGVIPAFRKGILEVGDLRPRAGM